MAQKIGYWFAVACAALALAFFVGDVALTNGNRALMAEISQRKSTIDLFASLGPLNQNLASKLAEMATKDNDMAARDLLTKAGITLPAPSAMPQATPPQAAPAQPAKAPATKK